MDKTLFEWAESIPLPPYPSDKQWRDCVIDSPMTWEEAERRICRGMPETVEYLRPLPPPVAEERTFTLAEMLECASEMRMSGNWEEAGYHPLADPQPENPWPTIASYFKAKFNITLAE